MSSDSLALFRRNASSDLQKLADEHLQHDLTPSDRALLTRASQTLSTHILVGSLLGLTLGSLLSFRLRRSRQRVFQAFKAREKPISLRFADGREEPIPDITGLVRPTPVGDVASLVFFGIAGLFVGGEGGVLTGMRGARGLVMKGGDGAGDGQARVRLESAWRGFRRDVLRRELEALDREEGEGKGGLKGMLGL